MIASSRPLGLAVAQRGLAWQAVLVVVGSAFIALAARVAIPLPFSPVPVTAQTFAVLVVAAALGTRLGIAAVVTYLVEGFIGLPVGAGGAFGPAWLAGPTGGYLVGFVAAAAAVGALADRGWDRHFATCAAAMLIGEILIYIFGLAWLSRFPLPVGLLDAGLWPFLIGDAYKTILAALALPVARRIARIA